jgi:ABC-type phosphate/phosphonate transport system permease subunit
MRRGLTVRIVVAGTLLAVVVSTTFAFLLVAIAQLREPAQLTRHARRAHRRGRDGTSRHRR